MGLSSQNGFCNLFQDKCNAVVLFGVKNMNLILDALQYSLTNMPVQGKISSYLYFMFYKPWNMQDRNCHHVQPCDFFQVLICSWGFVLVLYTGSESDLSTHGISWTRGGIRGESIIYVSKGLIGRPDRDREPFVTARTVWTILPF